MHCSYSVEAASYVCHEILMTTACMHVAKPNASCLTGTVAVTGDGWQLLNGLLPLLSTAMHRCFAQPKAHAHPEDLMGKVFTAQHGFDLVTCCLAVLPK